jgi:hypothetical protein
MEKINPKKEIIIIKTLLNSAILINTQNPAIT